MAWDHLDLSKPHLVYIVLGGFTSIFMLVSSIIKERLYIGEATVATIFGIIFGPYAADVIDPSTWGNVDQITLEFSRIVLVVQCFAVGVELPKHYMNRHWKSVAILLLPVMCTGWFVTALVIWWMFHDKLGFVASLCVAACVTATDPVLASSVVGKGKFAKRVPKHLRDLLSAESGCNDGLAFPFIYIAIYLLHYNYDAKHVTFHWLVYTILYECLFGCLYGVLLGYAARRAIRYAHEHDLIDRESFLVFYFVLALFCAGSGSILGVDDLLVGFSCGVGFGNDGWFQEKTEESHVSNVIDLLINLAFFVYFGTIIPWDQYNDATLGIHAWKLVVCGVFVLFFRRIPIMLVLKPLIADVKTWREALFAGHFGPIGVGAIFVAILARAELESGSTVPLAQVPAEGEFVDIIRLIWPITTFLVIVSIVVHGSSVAVFTLGQHINTFTLTISSTNAEEGLSWMDRLPRMASRSRTSYSRPDSEIETLGEKPSISIPKRRKEEKRRQKQSWDSGIGPGGLIHHSAILPVSQQSPQTQVPSYGPQSQGSAANSPTKDSEADLPSPQHATRPGSSSSREQASQETSHNAAREEFYREGSNIIIEDEEGNAKQVIKAPRRTETEDDQTVAEEAARIERQHGHRPHTEPSSSNQERHSTAKWKQPFTHLKDSFSHPKVPPKAMKRRGPTRQWAIGNTVIIEDEDGEVIKQFEIQPNWTANATSEPSPHQQILGRMSQILSYSPRDQPPVAQPIVDYRGKSLGGNNDLLAPSRDITDHARNAADASNDVSSDPSLPRGRGVQHRETGRLRHREDSLSRDTTGPLSSPHKQYRERLGDDAGNEERAKAHRKSSPTVRKRSQSVGSSGSAKGQRPERPEMHLRGFTSYTEMEETVAERQRRESVLGLRGHTDDDSDDSEDDGTGFRDPNKRKHRTAMTRKHPSILTRRHLHTRATPVREGIGGSSSGNLDTHERWSQSTSRETPNPTANAPTPMKLRWSADVGKKP